MWGIYYLSKRLSYVKRSYLLASLEKVDILWVVSFLQNRGDISKAPPFLVQGCKRKIQVAPCA
jgi:hypothetical protein